MYRLSRLRFVFPIGLFIAFFLDGSLSKIFAGQFFGFPYTMVSQLALLWIVLSCFFEEDVHIPLTAFAVLTGVIADLYYSGVWGLYIVLYPLLVWLTRLLSRELDRTFLNQILIFFIDICVFQLLNYWAYYMVGVAHVDFVDFLLDTLAPTLALNLVYFVICYWPINTLYSHDLALQKKNS